MTLADWLAHCERLHPKSMELTLDRVGYLSHPDWVADPAKRPDPALWRPKVDTAVGFAETVAWYRANGLL